MSKATGYAETEKATQVVNEVVVFIRFTDEPENIYDERGGYDYIMGMYNGAANSLKANIEEFSWGGRSGHLFLDTAGRRNTDVLRG